MEKGPRQRRGPVASKGGPTDDSTVPGDIVNTYELGARVVYDDEPLPVTDRGFIGVIVTPTAAEIRWAAESEYPIGPDQGYLLVQWQSGEDWDRSWALPSELRPFEGPMP